MTALQSLAEEPGPRIADVFEKLLEARTRAAQLESDQVMVDAHLTREGARRYGVVASAEGKLDGAATERLRRDMAASRGSTSLFDRGFTSIAELRDRCLKETGFEAPKEPRFATRYRAAAE